jgi:hypothetical protein
MLKNREHKVNQGCNLRWKLGDEQDKHFSTMVILRGRSLYRDDVTFT